MQSIENLLSKWRIIIPEILWSRMQAKKQELERYSTSVNEILKLDTVKNSCMYAHESWVLTKIVLLG